MPRTAGKVRFRTVPALLGLTALLGSALPSIAAEHITLRNGFDLICDHREAAGTHVRLYTGPASSNFVEVNASEIVSVEAAPDLAPPPVTAEAASIKPSAAEPTPEQIREMMARAGAEHNLDVDLLASVIRAESGGHIRAVSRTGAQGLMQLMPGTAAELGVLNSFAPEENISGGTTYLNGLLAYYHDNLPLALAAYNAGPAAVDKYHGIPPYRETRAYVARVIHEFNRRKTLTRPAPRMQQRAALPVNVAQGTAPTP